MQSQHEAAGIRARLKQIEGAKLTARESAALARWQKEYAAEARERILRAIPKGVYCELAGRAHNVVNEFGERYDIPVDVPEIDLYATINALHSRVSELAAAARPNLDADEAGLVREKLRQEIGKLQRQSAALQIDLDKHMEKLLAKSDVAAGLDWLSSRLRALGSHLFRAVGEPGVDAVNEFLDQLAAELEDGGALKF
jgi:hypothetical protein